MRIGMSLSSSYGVDDAREGARHMVERAGAAREAGLDSLFVGDHHNSGPRKYYQNIPILGRMLAEWGDRPAGALFLLPLWHPVHLAEQIGTLASIHRGRFIMQCAVGRADAQFTGLGVDARHRPSRFEQSLDIMQRLWAGETVSANGRWSFTDTTIAPLPPEPVDVWIAAMESVSIDRAARAGDAWLAAPGLTPDQAAARSAEYLERCEAYGRPPKAVAIRRDIYVGSNDEEARATTAPLVEAGRRGPGPSARAIGGPETVARYLTDLAEVGYTDVIARSVMPDQAGAMASIERLAEVRERVADA